jgi:bifunctional non-homologous end joining protein LigD
MPRDSVPRSKRQYVLHSSALKLARESPGVKTGAFPGFVEPLLATLRSKAPSADNWVHEIKFDGYRTQLHIRDRGIQFFTRRGNDWSDRFTALKGPAADIKTHGAILDGEVIVQTGNGSSDFGALQKDLGAGRSDRLVFYAFDLLYLDAHDLRDCTLLDRKRVLAELLNGIEGPLKYSEHLEGDGPQLFRNACAIGIEGIVSKRKDGRYRSGRSDNWVKATCRKRDTFFVAGIAQKEGKFDGLYLARQDGKTLAYAGKVETGFSEDAKNELRKRLLPLRSKKSALAGAINKPKAQWVKPDLKVDVEYRAISGDGKLRHPSFKGVRDDC